MTWTCLIWVVNSALSIHLTQHDHATTNTGVPGTETTRFDSAARALRAGAHDQNEALSVASLVDPTTLLFLPNHGILSRSAVECSANFGSRGRRDSITKNFPTHQDIPHSRAA